MSDTSPPFRETVTSEDELRAVVGTPSELALRKAIPALDHHCRAFIGLSPFVLVATASARGECDVSPKGDAPGFVLVLDDRRLVIPDRPGNRRLDGMRNLLENPHIGLLFLIPGKEETLRVNGRGLITRDPDLLGRVRARDKTPELAIGVEVEECFLHCAKPLKRSALWQTDAWPDLSALPSMARMLLDHARPAGTSVAELERALEVSYCTRLY
jgi:PPOX class probable FMN-dependent enzyme